MIWTLWQSTWAATWENRCLRSKCEQYRSRSASWDTMYIVWSRALLYFIMFYSTQWFYKRTVKAQIRLRGRAGWSGPSLPAYAQRHFSMARHKCKPLFYAICEQQRNWRDCWLANANTVRYLKFKMNGILYEQGKSWSDFEDVHVTQGILLFVSLLCEASLKKKCMPLVICYHCRGNRSDQHTYYHIPFYFTF